jgi:hypothetical protein
VNLSDLNRGTITTIEVRSVDLPNFSVLVNLEDEVQLLFGDITGHTRLRLAPKVGNKDRTYLLKGATNQQSALLHALRDRDLPRLVWVAAVRQDVLVLQVHEFSSLHAWGEMDLGVDEDIVMAVAKVRRRPPGSIQQTVAWLEERLLLSSPFGWPRLLISGVPKDEHETHLPQYAFRILGDGIAADLRIEKQGTLRIANVVTLKKGRSDLRPVFLVEAEARVVDATNARVFHQRARDEAEMAVAHTGSYLRLWQHYNALERKNSLQDARAFGWLPYHSRSMREDGSWQFRVEVTPEIQDKLQALRQRDTVMMEAHHRVPEELRSDQVGLDERRRELTFSGQVVGVMGDSVVLKPPRDDERDPAGRGYLYIGIKGDKLRLDRRDLAQQRIMSGDGPMPQLAMLLEGRRVSASKTRSIAPNSKAAEKLFGGRPTSRQLEALKVALNTPDIALIQGPPGTGKTRVIAALQQRLSEEYGRENVALSREILLTSYQHDAVENAADAAQVFGLPAVKIGRRRDQGVEDTRGNVDRWRQGRVEAVAAQLSQLPESREGVVLRRVRARAAAVLNSPQRGESALDLLQDTLAESESFLSSALRDDLAEAIRVMRGGSALSRHADEDDRSLAERAVRALRLTPTGFADDGSRNARKALRRLRELAVLTPEDETVLAEAADWEEELPPSPDLLARLENVQLDLLTRLTPGTEENLMHEPEVLLSRVLSELAVAARNGGRSDSAALTRFLDDLENDAQGIQEAVEQYTVVLAATCQQSVSYQMINQKGEDDFTFDTVIVDEAARANPLDLLIPMSRARNRIVLVGDHRQLPHLLEPDVERALNEDVENVGGGELRRSLFEKLFLDLKRREAEDGIQRTVTLDKQYRMHPVLGRFVSDRFYKPYKEAFESPRQEGEFEQDLADYAGKCAAWLHVPAERGGETGRQSKARPCEARVIAQHARRVMEDRTDFSVGIITFYKAQEQELWKELVKVGLAEQDERGDYRVSAPYVTVRSLDGRIREGLRIGTVDAFQGKEFDVVFLAATRSNALPCQDERAARRKFGHLTLENRLCVAMSRQQRLLVVAGDADMFTTPAARQFTPALSAYLDLTQGANGVFLHS